jgi:hypothetical protein
LGRQKTERFRVHNLIWLVILFPPVMAYWLWLGIGYKTRDTGASSNTSFGMNGQRVRLGRHGYWILLAICYAAFLGVGFALHKI